MSAPKYVFLIEDSSGNEYEFEKATSRAWEYYQNDVGRCRFFVPYNDLKLTTSSVPTGAFSEIRIYRDASLVWQGMVQIVQDTKDGTWVYGETFLAGLGWYGTQYNQAYSAQNISKLVGDEYDSIVGRSNDFLAAKITKGTIQNPYQTGTTTNLTVTRTLFNDNYLQLLKELVIVARGEMTSSWSQNTVFNISFSETAPTFTFTRDVGSQKADVVFELDSEIVDFNIPYDFRDIVNEGKGFAVAEGPSILTSTESDATSAGSWYRRERYPFYPNVTAQDDLDQQVDDLVLEKKDPYTRMDLKFAAGLTPFDGYVMGDSIKIIVSKGRVDIDEWRRVVGMEVTILDTGVEQTVPILKKDRT